MLAALLPICAAVGSRLDIVVRMDGAVVESVYASVAWLVTRLMNVRASRQIDSVFYFASRGERGLRGATLRLVPVVVVA